MVNFNIFLIMFNTFIENMSCSWCGRISQTCESERSNSLSCNMMDASGHFCSEACFAAGRKAVFKRGKTCDWCRHMRNPINYVDLQVCKLISKLLINSLCCNVL